MQDTITVILADSHYLIRVGIKYILSHKPEFRLLAEVENESELLAQLSRKAPDVIILDPHQPDKFSVSTIDEIKKVAPETEIMVISAHKHKSSVYKILESGVNCFLTKECDDHEILDGLRASAKGEKFFCKKILNLIWEKSFGKTEDCAGTPLTQREIEIVRMVASGKITKEIAYELRLSPHTVYTHRKNIMKKLSLSSTPELVLYAVNHGIVVPDSTQLN